jgi:hypothetical protein
MERSERHERAASAPLSNDQHPIGLGEISLDGIMAGVISASAIALFFLVVDLTRFEPLFTPSLLGAAIFSGEVPSAEHSVDMSWVGAYTLLHGSLFALIGILGAWALVKRGTSPGLGIVSMALFAIFEFGSIAAAAVYLPQLIPLLGAGTISVGNLLAALAMGTYLHGWQPHPGDRLAHVH